MTQKTVFQFKKNAGVSALKTKPGSTPVKPIELVRSRHVSAYLTDAEYARFLTRLDGRSASGVMRRLILTHLADDDETK